MASLPADLYSMKDSPSYQPILRAILKSQIQLLVEQLCETGEETLILTANARDGLVDQLGSNYGKQFVEVYDDFKAEFLGFCQKKDKKRKQVEDSPQQGAGDAKKARQGQVIIPIRVTKTGSGSEAVLPTSENVPKVSSARVITRPKQTSSQPSTSQESSVHSTPSIISTIEQSEEETISEEDESQDPSYTVMEESTDLGYENVEEIENWDSADVESSISETEGSQSVQSAKVTREGKTGKREKTTIENQKKPKPRKTDSGIDYEKMFSKASSCPECGKLFIRRDQIELHMLTHTGQYPHVCHICGQGYRKKNSYVIHMKKKHPNEVLESE